MDTLAKPSIEEYRELVSACASSYSQARTKDRKERILGSIDEIEEFGSAYDACANSCSLDTIRPHNACGAAKKDDLIDLYESKFVKSDSPGRETYMAIRNSAIRSRCPLCSQLPVSTVDHHLPKSKYPALSIYPRNLVPSCQRCNEIKGNETTDLTLHPYYDDVNNLTWLKCKLIQDAYLSVKFTVWEHVAPAALRTRMVNHLVLHGIDELYQISALSHLSDIKNRLCELGAHGGESAVREYLVEEYNSRLAHRTNTWGTALYLALSSEIWFTSGGYIIIES